MKKLFLYFSIVFFSFLTGCSDKSEKDAIKVVTLNIRYDNPYDSINEWDNRAPQVCAFILEEEPDILGLQEVLKNQYEVLDSLLVDYASVGVGRDDGAKSGEINPVFYRKERFDLVRTITFWLSETPQVPGSLGWGASFPRIVTWLELVDKNNHEHIFHFNTHFAHDSDSARMMSSRMLLREVDSIAYGFPFIITGDFNMLPSNPGYLLLTGPDESVPLLRDSYIISEKRPGGPIFTYNGFSDEPGPGRIDYIFVRNGMRVLNHSTFEKKENDIYISDHWPVEALVVINRE